MLFLSKLKIFNCSIGLINTNNTNLRILLSILSIFISGFLLKAIICSLFSFLRSKSIKNKLFNILRLLSHHFRSHFRALFRRKMRSKIFKILLRKTSFFRSRDIHIIKIRYNCLRNRIDSNRVHLNIHRSTSISCYRFTCRRSHWIIRTNKNRRYIILYRSRRCSLSSICDSAFCGFLKIFNLTISFSSFLSEI